MSYRSGSTATKKHSHAYEMVYTDRDCHCEGCGQRWYLKIDEDKAGKRKAFWVPVGPSGWD